MCRVFRVIANSARVMVAFGLILAIQDGTANASLVGDTVSCSDTVFNACTPASAVVGAGIEFSQYISYINIDLTGSQLILSNSQPTTSIDLAFAGVLTLSDLNWIGLPAAFVSGFAINTISGVANLTAADLSYTADSVSIDLNQTIFDVLSSVTFDIFFSTTTVPEPSAIALFSFALVGLVIAMKRRRSH